MDRFRIQVDNNSIAKYKDSITGVLYFDFSGVFFPEKGWNDFIIVLINNWLESSHNILRGITESEEFYFMDGPFFMRVRKIENEICIAELIENHTDILMEFRISITDLFNEVLKKVTSLSKYCKKQGWDTEDVKRLQYFNDKFITDITDL